MNTPINWKISQAVFLILLGLVFLSHFPFLEADPDRNMSVGRGPFTDEGLNTIQIRNWVNQGDLSLTECDNLLKTPLFGFPLALSFKIFGTTHSVARLHVLVLLFLALLWIGLNKKNAFMMTIFLLISLLQYPIFQSSHFSMAEMLSIAAILFSIHFFTLSSEPGNDRKSNDRCSILSGLFLSLSYFIKIQFIYIIMLIPVILAIRWFTTNFYIRKMMLRQGLLMTGTLLFFLLVYLLAWYLPNKEAYDYMMAHQSGEFKLSNKVWEYIRFNLDYHFLKGWNQWFVYGFLILVVSGFKFMKTNHSTHFNVWFLSSLAWFVIELHKITMVYLPTRYQVSLFVSMGLLMSIVLSEFITSNSGRWKIVLKTVAVSLVIFFSAINMINYSDTYRHRSYAIRDVNQYLARNLDKNDLVLGAWAPSLTWDSRAKAIPVWNDFLNYRDPLIKFKPEAIISEIDEQDSEQAWKSQGIFLREMADSSKTARIGQWDVVIWWLPYL